MSIFPMIQPVAEPAGGTQALPLCREVAWDFVNDIPVFRSGEPVIVTGREAVKVWAWKALHTVRYRHEIYSWDYGSEFEELVGQAYTPILKEAEAPRYLKEALLINPYITAVTNIAVSFSAGRLTVAGAIQTIYGEVEIYVTV